MLVLVDASVILRYLLGDHEEMAEEARSVILTGAETVPAVLAEVVYVLDGVYGVPRVEIAAALLDLLDDVLVEPAGEMRTAVRTYGETSLDFVDCMLVAACAESGRRVLTFDRKLRRLLESAEGGESA